MSWADDGNSFYISNPTQFNQVLGKYFKTRNISSFIRQLNMYSFSKVRNANGFYEFRNPFFQRGNLAALGKIKRKFVGPKKAGATPRNTSEQSVSEADSNRTFDTRMMILGDQFKRLLETNKELNTKIETLQREKDEQLKVMSNVIFGIVKSCNTGFMKRLRSVLFEEQGAGKARYSAGQSQQMMACLAALISGKGPVGMGDYEHSVDQGDHTVFGDNFSDVIDQHLSKRFQPMGPRPVIIPDREYEERSKLSVSDSCMESKISEGNYLKQAFGLTTSLLDNRTEMERYSALDAYEIQTVQREDSKMIDNCYPTKMHVVDEDKEELDFGESRKCSLDLFEGDRNN